MKKLFSIILLSFSVLFFAQESIDFQTTTFKEVLAKARLNNGTLINRRESYVEGLLIAKNAVTVAEETLADYEAKIAFLEEELKNLSKEE